MLTQASCSRGSVSAHDECSLAPGVLPPPHEGITWGGGRTPGARSSYLGVSLGWWKCLPGHYSSRSNCIFCRTNALVLQKIQPLLLLILLLLLLPLLPLLLLRLPVKTNVYHIQEVKIVSNVSEPTNFLDYSGKRLYVSNTVQSLTRIVQKVKTVRTLFSPLSIYLSIFSKAFISCQRLPYQPIFERKQSKEKSVFETKSVSFQTNILVNF